MRRIYESQALSRDDDDPFAPSEQDGSDRPQAARSINSTALSDALIPSKLRQWAISCSISTPRSEYHVGTSVPFTVTMKNAMPFPITIPTRSPRFWVWSVDGSIEASQVPVRDPPEEVGRFRFNRGERKQFKKRWNGMFRVSKREWQPAPPGEYRIEAALNVEKATHKGLSSETTVRLADK